MNQTRMLLAVRDVLDEELRALPAEEESTPEERAALLAGMSVMFEQGRLAMATVDRRPPPGPRPVALGLQAPANGAPCVIVDRKLPSLKPEEMGKPFQPLPLNVGSVTYFLHVGANHIPADLWEGVPESLAEAYKSGAIVVTQPGDKHRATESLPLLFSRARSIAYGLKNIPPGQQQDEARAAVAAELARIMKKVPPTSGAIYEAVKSLNAIYAPAPQYAGPKNLSSAEQRRAAQRTRAEAQRAKALAKAAGDLPEDVELDGAFAAAAVASGQPIARNSFGTPGARK